MEPEVSLLCSQQPATGPYPETRNQTTASYPTSLRSIWMLSPIYSHVFRVVSFH
jgi:hypothetical protein